MKFDVVPFGKYKGKSIDEVPASYLQWCLLQDFVESDYPQFYNHLLDNEGSIMKELGGS